MTMRHLESELRTSGDPHDQERANLVAAMLKARGKDVALPQTAFVFENQLRTPELATETFQRIWRVRGETVGMNFEVTPCPYTEEKLAEFKRKGIRIGFLPPILATQQSRHILGEMFPQMRSSSVQKDNPVVNDEDLSGWFTYETSIDAPYPNTTERQLKNKVARNGGKLLSLNQYIVATQDSKLFTGQYLDESLTWVRLSSRIHGRVVDVGTRKDGYLYVWCDRKPTDRSPHLGGRTSEEYNPTP